MDIRLFADSVHDLLEELTQNPAHLGAAIFNHFDRLPKWRDLDLALIGADSEPGSADLVRRELYQLTRSRDNYRLADLGNLRPAADREQTAGRLREVCAYLLDQGVLPVVLTDDPSLLLAQYLAHEHLGQPVALAVVDSRADLTETQPLGKILAHQPNYLFGLSLLGHQQYLVAPEHLALLQKLNADLLSVGKMRDHFRETEPVLRGADLVGFHLGAVRRADAPANRARHPFGLTGEEICQLAWYAGHAERLRSVGFYGYQADADPFGHTAALLATMVWYLVEGFYHRSPLQPFTEDFYIKLHVPVMGDSLVFYKHRHHDKWWLEVPLSGPAAQAFGAVLHVPCSQLDYEQAVAGSLPDRWVRAVERAS
jgi:formiminoglutamase